MPVMQVSPSLAEFMERLDEGPRGSGDAIAAITKCADESGRLLDLQQMNLTNEDLELIAPKLAAISSHVKELNLFMNEYGPMRRNSSTGSAERCCISSDSDPS